MVILSDGGIYAAISDNEQKDSIFTWNEFLVKIVPKLATKGRLSKVRILSAHIRTAITSHCTRYESFATSQSFNAWAQKEEPEFSCVVR